MSRPGSHVGSTRTTREESVAFVYLGKTTLNVIGSGTGRQYRFTGHGAELHVHPLDAPGLSMIPVLAERTPVLAERRNGDSSTL